jgi:hypothetical protein
MAWLSSTTTPTPNPGPTLTELEAVIAAGLETFAQVGQALQAIRTRKLYKDRHATFEVYLADRWKMSVDYAKKLIEAAAICDALQTAGLPAPTREAHVRELKKVPTEARPEAWKETLTAAGKPDNVTAELVATIATKHRTKKARRKAPRTIVLKGKGWSIRLERKSVDVSPVAALNEALAKLTTTTSTSTPAAA